MPCLNASSVDLAAPKSLLILRMCFAPFSSFRERRPITERKRGEMSGPKQQPRSQNWAGGTSAEAADSWSDPRVKRQSWHRYAKSGEPCKRRFSALHLVGQGAACKTANSPWELARCYRNSRNQLIVAAGDALAPVLNTRPQSELTMAQGDRLVYSRRSVFAGNQTV